MNGFDFDTNVERRKINIFKIGGIWCFKHFFNDREVFNKLSGYYNREKYRFELKNIEKRKEVINYLKDKGFEIALIENSSDYTIKISKYNEYREILKNSIEAYESGRDKIFIMKDLVSVEEAIEKGAVKCLSSPYRHFSGLAPARPTVSQTSQTGGDSNIERCIQIKYLGCNEIDFYTCEWIFILSNVEARELFDIRRWVNGKVRLGRTARIWIERRGLGYSMKISGGGEDGRCEWCRSFFTALRRKAERERISISENWRCPFEEPIHPRDRYGRRIEQLLREYR